MNFSNLIKGFFYAIFCINSMHIEVFANLSEGAGA
jgi:hypothetical protein